MSLPSARAGSQDSEWFVARCVRPSVWLIAEPGHVGCWLVEGTTRAVLIDTGLGIAPLRPVVESLTVRPVSVVNTHYHFDHVGGNHEFDDVAIHRLGAPRLTETLSDRAAAGYMQTTASMLELSWLYRAIDASTPGLLMPESIPRQLPKWFDASKWTTRPSSATRRLEDGDVIDLGGRELLVLHMPGHSPDGIALWDERHGLLFLGDVLSYGHIYGHFADSDLSEYSATLRRLEAHPAAHSLYLLGHCERPVADMDLLAETRAIVEQARGGSPGAGSLVDVVGNGALVVSGARVGVTIPDPAVPVPALNVPPGRSTRLAQAGGVV